MGFPVGIRGKDLPASAGDMRDTFSILASGRSPGGGNGNPLQYSVLLLGESHEQRSLEVYSPRGHKELDTTEAT